MLNLPADYGAPHLPAPVTQGEGPSDLAYRCATALTAQLQEASGGKVRDRDFAAMAIVGAAVRAVGHLISSDIPISRVLRSLTRATDAIATLSPELRGPLPRSHPIHTWLSLVTYMPPNLSQGATASQVETMETLWELQVSELWDFATLQMCDPAGLYPAMRFSKKLVSILAESPAQPPSSSPIARWLAGPAFICIAISQRLGGESLEAILQPEMHLEVGVKVMLSTPEVTKVCEQQLDLAVDLERWGLLEPALTQVTFDAHTNFEIVATRFENLRDRLEEAGITAPAVARLFRSMPAQSAIALAEEISRSPATAKLIKALDGWGLDQFVDEFFALVVPSEANEVDRGLLDTLIALVEKVGNRQSVAAFVRHASSFLRCECDAAALALIGKPRSSDLLQHAGQALGAGRLDLARAILRGPPAARSGDVALGADDAAALAAIFRAPTRGEPAATMASTAPVVVRPAKVSLEVQLHNAFSRDATLFAEITRLNFVHGKIFARRTLALHKQSAQAAKDYVDTLTKLEAKFGVDAVHSATIDSVAALYERQKPKPIERLRTLLLDDKADLDSCRALLGLHSRVANIRQALLARASLPLSSGMARSFVPRGNFERVLVFGGHYDEATIAMIAKRDYPRVTLQFLPERQGASEDFVAGPRDLVVVNVRMLGHDTSTPTLRHSRRQGAGVSIVTTLGREALLSILSILQARANLGEGQ